MDNNLYLSRGVCKQLGDRPAYIFAFMLNRQADGYNPLECDTGSQVIELEEQGYFPYSKVDLARGAGMATSTVSRHIKKLIDAGLIEEVKRKGEPCFYRIVERKEWIAWLHQQRRQSVDLIKRMKK